MKHSTFKKTQLATSMALLMGSTLALPTFAQEAESTEAADDIEVIQVSGIRGSMMRSMDLKRGSNGVVDAISAEELGKFPDTNLEYLQLVVGSRALGVKMKRRSQTYRQQKCCYIHQRFLALHRHLLH